MRIHEKFNLTEFPEGVVAVTRDFFDSKPWQGTTEIRLAKFKAWYSSCCEVMGYDEANLALVRTPDDVRRSMGFGRLVPITALTVVNLFHAFRHDMLRMGQEAKMDNECRDCDAWAYSLFFVTRPKTFAASVRKGMIEGVTEADLVPLDAAGCVLSPEQRGAFEVLSDAFMDSLGDEDHDLMDLMAEFTGEGN